MGGNARRAERRRLKRQQRKRLLKRAEGGSPYRRIGTWGQAVACYINRDWQTDGHVSVFLLRSVPSGGHAMAAFFIDLWCAGLKDAWGRLDITREEFDETLDRFPRDVHIVRVDLEVAKRLVAGGILFAQQNGFRLPPHHKRWVALLGDVGDWASADLTDFGMAGGRLRYIGTTEDLRRRLIGCGVDEFLARRDVEFILGDEPFSTLDEADLAVEEVKDITGRRGLEAVRRWCFTQGEAPHPRLPEALDLTLDAILDLKEIPEPDQEPDAETIDEAIANMTSILDLESPHRQVELEAAMAQLHRFMQQFRSPEELCAALGLAEDEPE